MLPLSAKTLARSHGSQYIVNRLELDCDSLHEVLNRLTKA